MATKRQPKKFRQCRSTLNACLTDWTRYAIVCVGAYMCTYERGGGGIGKVALVDFMIVSCRISCWILLGLIFFVKTQTYTHKFFSLSLRLSSMYTYTYAHACTHVIEHGFDRLRHHGGQRQTVRAHTCTQSPKTCIVKFVVTTIFNFATQQLPPQTSYHWCLGLRASH